MGRTAKHVAGAALLFASLASASCKRTAADAPSPSELTVLEDLAPLRAALNAHPERVRLLMLLSPT